MSSRQAKAIELWAMKVQCEDGERFAFEWVTIADPAWTHRRWLAGVVTHRVRPGNCEGHVLEILVDGSVIVRAKGFRGELAMDVAGALLARALAPRVARHMRAIAAEREFFDRKTAELMGRNMGAWFARNERNHHSKGADDGR